VTFVRFGSPLPLRVTLGALRREVDLDPYPFHLLKSLEHSDYVAIVTSARSRKCAFTFDDAKLRKPGRCPSCRGTWIEPARIGLRTRARQRKRSKG
jgi:predicted Zn-ribbon and HTH transcriptional regulator